MRSSDFVLIKKRNNRCKTKAAGSSRVAQCKQNKFFVTGEVFLIDIDLLMGAILLNMARVHINTGNLILLKSPLEKSI